DGSRFRRHVEPRVSKVKASDQNNAPGREIVDVRNVNPYPKSAEFIASPGVADFEIHTIVVDVLDGGVDDDRPVHDALDMHFNVAWVDTRNVRTSLKLQDILTDPASVPDLHLWDEVDLPCSEQTLRYLRFQPCDVGGSDEPLSVNVLERHRFRLFGPSPKDLLDIVQSSGSDDPHVEPLLRGHELPCAPRHRPFEVFRG